MRWSRPRCTASGPILLTAAAAILGMVPIAPTVFWGPMAYAIMGGLAVATLLTLVFLPALYVAWFRIEAPHHAGRAGRWPASRSDPERWSDAMTGATPTVRDDVAQRRRQGELRTEGADGGIWPSIQLS